MTDMPTLPQAHVYIASLGRSGSTLIANLLTTPPDRLVLVEPFLHQGGGNAWMFDQLARWGWTIGADELARWRDPSQGGNHGQRAAHLLAERLAGLARWGVKEVEPQAHQPNIALLRPRQIILLVRDIRDVVLSYVEKYRREGHTAFGQELLTHLVTSTEVLTTLATTIRRGRTRIVRYEDFVASAEERNRLADWLDWPLDGDPNRNLDLYRRSYEIQRHGGTISQVSVARRALVANPTDADLATRIGEFLIDYQRRFGYDTSG